jgi:hypothetical protein
LGGTWNDSGDAIAVDAAGNVYVAGATESRDFPTTPGTPRSLPRPSIPGSRHRPTYLGFVAKLDASGRLVWSTYLGGSVVEVARDVAVDSEGNVYVTGSTESQDFPVTSDVLQSRYAGGDQPGDAYVVKLRGVDGKIVYATYLGGTDAGISIDVDQEGNAYLAGNTASADFPLTRDGSRRERNREAGVFVAKLSADGRKLRYSTLVGATVADRATGITVDTQGCAYVTGVTASRRFPGQSVGSRGGADVFVVKLKAGLGQVDYAVILGGQQEDTSSDIAVDRFGAAYVSGTTRSRDFPVTGARLQLRYGGGASDGFIAKIAPIDAAIEYATFIGGSSWEELHGIAVDGQGRAIVTGRTARDGHYPETSPAAPPSHTGGACMVLSHLSGSGNKLLFSKRYCADNPTPMFSMTIGHAVAVQGRDVFVTGWTACSTFRPRRVWRSRSSEAGMSRSCSGSACPPGHVQVGVGG